MKNHYKSLRFMAGACRMHDIQYRKPSVERSPWQHMRGPFLMDGRGSTGSGGLPVSAL
jgi:hypothetical protein